MLNVFKDREVSYTGEQLQRLVPPTETILPEVIRVYHDECCYASHESALSLWLPRGTQAGYKKPRGHIVMCSGLNPFPYPDHHAKANATPNRNATS
jgi:hypothetical protein